jgi:PAP2 superfamily
MDVGSPNLYRNTLSTCLLFVLLIVGPVSLQADVVLDWNVIAQDTSLANFASPCDQARQLAIVQLAVFEAVNSITRTYQPYLGTIVGRAGASQDAAAAQAAHDVLVSIFPASQAQLDQQLAASLAVVPNGQPKTAGIATGQAAAAGMLALRANDGSFPPKFYTPGPPVPGAYQATPGCPVIDGVAKGVFFHWQDVKPFGIPDAHAFLLPPPPALNTPRYSRAYNEVQEFGSELSTSRTVEQSNIATFYAATPPALIFNEAAQQASREGYRSLVENARALALVNMALNDSMVATFYNKYHYVFWRPETAIHAGDSDENAKTVGDPFFVPFIGAPCFPSYPSNHGSAAAGGAEVLRRLYGEAGHLITITNPWLPGMAMQYTRFGQISNDISDARVYGGIHFRTDQDAGSILGRAVGTTVYKNNLRPAHGKD